MLTMAAQMKMLQTSKLIEDLTRTTFAGQKLQRMDCSRGPRVVWHETYCACFDSWLAVRLDFIIASALCYAPPGTR